jgi:hypothetical protein
MRSHHVEGQDQPAQGRFDQTLWAWLVHFFLQLVDMWALGCIPSVYHIF